MKQILKYIFLLSISIFLLGFIAIYFLKKSISHNLELKKSIVENSWRIFNDKLNERDKVFSSLSLNNPDSLEYLINKSISQRVNKDNSVEIVFNEYKLNEFIMRQNLSSNNSISTINNSLNNLKTKYTSAVQDYNIYISTFPNFIIAKREGYTKSKRFDFVYGQDNADPIKKSKELPEWAKNVDTN